MERTPSSSGLRRTPIIQLDMGAVAQQLAAAKRGGEGATGGGSGGMARRVRPRPPEALLRCCSFCRFCWTCTAGACCSMVRAVCLHGVRLGSIEFN